MNVQGTTLRISATTLLREPSFYYTALAYSQARPTGKSTIQITFTHPSKCDLYTGRLAERVLVPFTFVNIDFRFLPSADTRPYIFDPKTFLSNHMLDRPRAVALTFPFLGKQSRSGSSVRIITNRNQRFNYGSSPVALHLFADSWHPDAFPTLPAVIADLLHAFASPGRATPQGRSSIGGPRQVTISLPRNLQANKEMVRSWKYSNWMKLHTPTILECEVLHIHNMTSDAFDHLFFLANIVPTHVRNVFVSPLPNRPVFCAGYNKADVVWREKVWAKENVITNLDLSAFNACHWQRDAEGRRIPRAGKASSSSLTQMKRPRTISHHKGATGSVPMEEFEQTPICAAPPPGYKPVLWHDIETAFVRSQRYDVAESTTMPTVQAPTPQRPFASARLFRSDTISYPSLSTTRHPGPQPAASLSTKQPTTTISPRASFNLFPSERQSWLTLETVCVVVDDGLVSLREQEKRDIIESCNARDRGEAKRVTWYSLTSEEMRARWMGGFARL